LSAGLRRDPDLKVRRRVVPPAAVNVVDVLMAEKASAKYGLGDDAMYQVLLATARDDSDCG